MKSKDLYPRLLHPARLSFKIEEEIRSFPYNKNLMGFFKKKKESRQVKINKGKNFINKMALYTYLSIITLTVNSLNAPTKNIRKLNK